MDRKLWLACLICLCVCAESALSPVAYAAGKPNIIVIMTDDAGMNNFGFSADLFGGTRFGETPNIDALAGQSVVLKQGYSAAPVCSTSRAGLLTGQYQQRYGFEYNLSNANQPGALQQAGTTGLNQQQVTIAEHLKGLGYNTGAIGKWHLGYADDYNRPQDKGFDEFFGFLGGDRQFFGSCCDGSSMRRGDTIVENQWRTEGDHSQYDPVKGRYVTDAFGEEAVDFINRHSGDANPFFLYVALTAPHTPWDAKQSDLDHFAHIADATDRMQAAMLYATDRAVGNITASLANNGVDNNTIVVFTNDNGPSADLQRYSTPLRGWKGTTYEGGIRQPFVMKVPGVAPHVYNSPVTFYDMLPTLYSAAGGDISQVTTDGYDVMPYLTGEQTDDPNKVHFWRHGADSWAVRKGTWKLVKPVNNDFDPWLQNVGQNPLETDYLQNAYPLVVADLMRELTKWEATLKKPQFGSFSASDQNLFDRFVFRNGLAALTKWSASNAWLQGGTANIVTATPSDAYANGIFEFTTRDDADFTAQNDMQRLSHSIFMLNQFRFSGTFAGTSNHRGTVNGKAVLLVKSLDGQLPRLQLDAAASGTTARFAFQVDNELQLLDDLEITGDGTQDFVINGAIRDYYEPKDPTNTTPHNVRKLGTSTVTLAGNNTFKGTLTVERGQVTLQGPSATIANAAGINVLDQGNFTLSSGTVTVPWINKSAGGQFHLDGGTLKVRDFTGDLTNAGGVYSPGLSVAVSRVTGNFGQTAGRLLIELGGNTAGTQYDVLLVEGSANLGGILDVDFVNAFAPTAGRAFQVLAAAGGVQGTFAQTDLPALASGLFWNVMYGANTVILAVAPTNSLTYIPGDFNHNGTVDAADYTMWRDLLGTSSSAADANFDGQVTVNDYAIWKSNFGFSLSGAGTAALALAVPEPGTAVLCALGAFSLLSRRKKS